MLNVDTAYYLVHSMGASGNFIELDSAAAKNFGEAARECGIQRIIYLGGLGAGNNLSPHLQSRQDVGNPGRFGCASDRVAGIDCHRIRESVI